MNERDLNYYYNKFKYGEDCFHYLMSKKVKEILLISTFYDAFIFEQDGRLSEQIFGEYRQLNLSTAPMITSVPTGEEALRILKERQFDLVITMLHVGKITSFDLARQIKENYPDLPILLLLNMESDIPSVDQYRDRMTIFDGVFLWKGDTKLFLAMVKSIEDKRNLEYDTKHGLVRVILLVEDSVQYYSMFLPLFYEEIMKQTQILIREELNDINKRLRMRARPKVILAKTYEEAAEIYEHYKEYIIAVISDISYLHNGKLDNEAGIKLISEVKKNIYDVPTILLSSEFKNSDKAAAIQSTFLYKYSNQLLNNLRKFIVDNLGFGDFVFRDVNGNEIDRARSLIEFEEKLKTIPDETIVYHSKRNHFSAWLMARGETFIARSMRLLTVGDFDSISEVRQHLVSTLNQIRKSRNKGKIINFHPKSLYESNEISRLTEGSLGGKGRGLAFLNALLITMEFEKHFTGVNITLPATAIIGTNEFDQFIRENRIFDRLKENQNDREIGEIFLKGRLSNELTEKLSSFLEIIRYPLAVRSSGLLEDSYSQPFAGIYRTYMIPNNHPDKSIRLAQLVSAIKLVFASVFVRNARKYIENLNHQVEEEKMAVIIQKVVGVSAGDYFYPHISGVAQSYNFYPVANLANEDGIATVSVGLGKSVIEGGKCFRFCPRYPNIEFVQPQALWANSQKEFFALNLKQTDFDLLESDDATISQLPISEAETHGYLEHIASVWDYADNRLVAGQTHKGARVITFDDILKYDYIPLGEITHKLLDIGEKAFGMPVEIEFAVDLTKDWAQEINPTFYILQIRPLAVGASDVEIHKENLSRDSLLLYTEKGMGNGVIDYLCDIIYLQSEKFDNLKTVEMQDEIEHFNEKLKAEDREYILIGPGRWGSQDRFLGIPAKFIQISQARVIVETGLENFSIDPSQGTHFFHNIVAMKIGYFTVPFKSVSSFIDTKWLNDHDVVEEGKYFRHIRLEKPLTIRMDGKTGIAVIEK